MRRLLLLSVIWGWSFLFIKVAVAGMSPATVAWGRVTLGAAFLAGVLRVKSRADRRGDPTGTAPVAAKPHGFRARRADQSEGVLKGVDLPRSRRLWVHFAIVGLAGSALPFTMLAWGEQRISSGLTSVLNASTPLFTAVIAAFLLRERLRRAQRAGLVIGLVGVAVAAGVGRSDLDGSSLAGATAAVLAGLCYGFTFTWSKRYLMGVAPAVAALGQLTAASALLLPVALATSLAEGVHLSATRVIAMLLLGVVGSGVAYVLNFRIIADLGPTRASLVTYLIPIVAVAVGIAVLDERFQFRAVTGGLLIVGGIVLVNRGRARRGVPAVIAAVALIVLFAGCGSSGGGTADRACDPVRREPLDRSYLVHILPGAPAPDYLSDPPTSGRHQPSPRLQGALDRPIDRPVQVGLLEAGAVLIQHRGLSGPDRTAIEGLAGAEVVVAPNDALPAGTAVVATAWLTKRTCQSVDVATLSSFVADHRNRSPGAHGGS